MIEKNGRIWISPASKKQERLLNSTATITLGGGSAGGGKTYTALLIVLKFMSEPNTTGVVFRRTSKMLTAPGSVWSEAISLFNVLYPNNELKIKHRETEILFPNGSHLKMSHMQHLSNMYDHKGGQYSLVIFDETTDFEETQVLYLLSRMRNAKSKMKPQMFLLTNPEYHSFLRHWIQDFYLDPQTGIPLEEKAGVMRYFFRQGNTMLWYNSLEEAEAVHGKGETSGISSFTFFPFTCLDNPPLLKAQPDYVSRLKSLPRVEMEKLLLGSWFARIEASQMWKREWVNFVDFPNGRARKRVRAWDLAFTRPSEQNPNPDWTAGVLMSKDKQSVYTVEDAVRIRDRVKEVEDLIFETAKRDGKDVVISIPKDPNASAGAYARGLQRRLAENGFSVLLSPPVKSKITRFAPFASVTQAGFVNVVVADWNKDYFEELEIFNGDKKNKDDLCDATADCFSVLNKNQELPTFSLPDLAGGSQVITSVSNLGANESLDSRLIIPKSNVTLPSSPELYIG